MLHQNEEKSKQEKEGQQRFMGAVKTLGIAALLWQNNIRKESRKYGKEKDGSRRSAYELFKTLLLLVFQGENLYRFLSSDSCHLTRAKRPAQRTAITGFWRIVTPTGTGSLCCWLYG